MKKISLDKSRFDIRVQDLVNTVDIEMRDQLIDKMSDMIDYYIHTGLFKELELRLTKLLYLPFDQQIAVDSGSEIIRL